MEEDDPASPPSPLDGGDGAAAAAAAAAETAAGLVAAALRLTPPVLLPGDVAEVPSNMTRVKLGVWSVVGIVVDGLLAD